MCLWWVWLVSGEGVSVEGVAGGCGWCVCGGCGW